MGSGSSRNLRELQAAWVMAGGHAQWASLMWEFPNIRGTYSRGFVIRIIVVGGSILGVPHFGKRPWLGLISGRLGYLSGSVLLLGILEILGFVGGVSAQLTIQVSLRERTSAKELDFMYAMIRHLPSFLSC